MENDSEFDHIRGAVESALTKPEKKSFTIKNRKIRKFLSLPFITIALIIANVLIFLYTDMILNILDKTLFYLEYANISQITLDQKEYKYSVCFGNGHSSAWHEWDPYFHRNDQRT